MGIPKAIFSLESHHPPYPCISGEIRHHPSVQLVVLFVVVSSFSRVVAISPSTPCLFPRLRRFPSSPVSNFLRPFFSLFLFFLAFSPAHLLAFPSPFSFFLPRPKTPSLPARFPFSLPAQPAPRSPLQRRLTGGPRPSGPSPSSRRARTLPSPNAARAAVFGRGPHAKAP